MKLQRWECVIDLFGVSYDGTMPNIVLACDETWLGLFPVAPPNPPALDSADRPEGGFRFFFEPTPALGVFGSFPVQIVEVKA